MPSHLLSDQKLNIGDALVSDNGHYALVLQGDGNLVLYRDNHLPALWASGTDGQTATLAVMQSDGNFVLYGVSGRVAGGAIWASGTDGKGGISITLQNDGNLVIYRSDGGAVWATNTDEPSQPNVPGSPNRRGDYCCTIFKGDGTKRASETVRASSKTEATAKCARLMSNYGGKGFGVGSGSC